MDIQTGQRKYQAYFAQRRVKIVTRLTLFVACLHALHSQAQLRTYPLAPTANARASHTNALTNPVSLPFWDDFSSQASLDTSLWEPGSNVHVNESLGRNTPTYRLVTFDGLKSDGLAYDIEGDGSTSTDVLTSQPILLGDVPKNQNDSTYLSFFWQAGGNGELPDREDKLELHFKRSTGVWDLVWEKRGGIESAFDKFKQEVIPLELESYFHDDFQFRFTATTSQQGPFDTWHVDYVYLDTHRNLGDTLYLDRGLTGSISSPFGLYQEIPADHFFSATNIALTSPTAYAFNLDNTIHPLEYSYRLTKATSGELLANITETGNLIQPQESRILRTSTLGAISTTPSDSLALESTFYYTTGDDIKVNDTIRRMHVLHNHYAYDDGAAEFAVGISQKDGRLMMGYDLFKQDTLTAIEIYFPNIAPKSSNRNIFIEVWRDFSDNAPVSRVPYSITNPSGINVFSRVDLSQPLPVEGTIYIGFQQSSQNEIPVGFDRDNPDAANKIFFTDNNGNWLTNSRLKGALMIRPVFDLDSAFVLAAQGFPAPLFYPNPATDHITFNHPPQYVKIYAPDGKITHPTTTKEGSYDVSHLKSGIFIVEYIYKQQVFREKLLIR